MTLRPAYVVALTLASIVHSYGHATTANHAARIGQPYRAAFVIPHGCDGQPTIEVVIKVPEGFLEVQPQPVGQWQVNTRRGAYSRSHRLGGETVTSGVTEVSWSGGSLADSETQTFEMTGTFAEDLVPGLVHFPLVQVCPNGEEAWIGTTGSGDEYPAPDVSLTR
jgi:uncharacterized protein YcnI